MRLVMGLLPLLAAGCASHSGDRGALTARELETYPQVRGMPVDVARFMIRWSDCQHFLSEPAWDERRGRDLARAADRICPGIDAEGAAVRARYSEDLDITDTLAGYAPLGR